MGTGPSSPDEKGSTIAGLTTATTGSKRLNDEGFGIILVSKSSSSDSSSRIIAAFRFIDQIFRRFLRFCRERSFFVFVKQTRSGKSFSALKFVEFSSKISGVVSMSTI